MNAQQKKHSPEPANEARPAAPDAAGFENVVPFDEMSAAERMHVSLEGFEGPLDLLLNLARTQKVDLAKISILELANQYLQFIADARALRLEIAADYLVTAAWLAFLKSKLLLPVEAKQDEGPSGEDMALHLAFRLKRLEAMREAVARIFNRAQQGMDFFARGEPEGIRTVRKSDYWASVYDLLKAYAEQRGRNAQAEPVKMGGRKVWSIREARERLQKLFGTTINWSILDSYLEDYLHDAEVSKTALASSFGATLELTREGFTEIRQAQAFAPIYVRWLKQTPSQGDPGDPTSVS